MNNELQSVLSEIVFLARGVFSLAGDINDTASRVLVDFGIMPPYQLYLFMALAVTVSVVALRAFAGLLGWLVVLLLLLLLLQRVAPGIGMPGGGASPNMPVVHPLQNAL